MPFDFAHSKPAHGARPRDRQQRGALNFQAGQSAEYRVAQDYNERGYTLLQQRWRGKAGEIDLIFAHDHGVVFVEVKKSRSFDRAIASLGARQISRLFRAGEEYLGTQPNGSLTDVRFDVAVLNERGEMQVVENALMG